MGKPALTSRLRRRMKGMTFVEIIVVIAIALGIAVAVVLLVQKYGQKTVDTEKKMKTDVPSVGA